MTLQRSVLIALSLTAASAAVGAWAYSVLPAGAFLAYHHTLGGPADGHLDKGHALALMPSIAALVTACLSLAPRRARDEGLERSVTPFGLLIIGLAGVFFVAEGAIAWRMVHADTDVVRIVFLAVAVMLAVVGNYLGKVRHNRVFGVRTRWTLKDPRVWDKTHRVAGRLMVLGGVGLALACLFVADLHILVALMVALTAGPPICAAGYSLQVYRREHPAQASPGA